MSPLGVPKWKIEFAAKSAPKVTKPMSPLVVAQWKIETGAKNVMPSPQKMTFVPQIIFS